VFELLVYPLPGEKNQTTQYIEMADKKSDLVLDSVRAFADSKFGVDLFKVESPCRRARSARPPRSRFRTPSTRWGACAVARG
jgi:tagatose-1,6-bisphosphate aldolase